MEETESGESGELEDHAPVEIVDSELEAEVALLNEVEELHGRGKGVAAGDRDDEAKVGADEAVLGLCALAGEAAVLGCVLTGLDGRASLGARLHQLRALALLVGGEQGHQSALVEDRKSTRLHSSH